MRHILIDRPPNISNADNIRPHTHTIVRNASWMIMCIVIITRLTSFSLGFPKEVDETTYFVLLGSTAFALIFIKLNRADYAAWLFLLGCYAGLFYASYTSELGQTFAITGYVLSLVLSIMILPGRQWIVFLVLAIIAIVAATVICYVSPPLNTTSEEHLTYGVVQLCVIFIASVTVRKLYISVQKLVSELQESNANLEELHREAKEKSDLLEVITANLPVRVAYFDSQNNLHFHNKAFKDAYQVQLDNAIATFGHTVRLIDAASPDLVAKRQPHIDLATSGETVVFELDEMRPDGTLEMVQNIYIPHKENGEVIGRVSLGIDISELRHAQKSLQESLELFDHVINNVPARIAYINRDNVLVFVNNRVKEHFGVTIEEAVGRQVQSFLPADYFERVYPYAVQAYESKQEVVFETPLTLHGGKEIIERSYYYPHIINGRVEALFMLHMDVTQIKRTEASLSRAQKLESLGVLAGGIAHDFNNLLVAMLGQNSLALAKIEASHPAKRHIVQSIAASERAATLTQQMLAYSGRGSFTIGAINLNQLIADNLKLFEVSIPKRVQLVTNLLPNLPCIEADTAQMQQLIMNLIINAGQAIGDKNGRITISTSIEMITPDRGEFWEITGDTLVPGAYASIQVQDDGMGMDEDTKNKIFDPFYTTKETGTGLGLAAALGIIRGHNGGIRLYSEVGYGTVFHLLFPLMEEALPTGNRDVVLGDSAELTQTHTILVIDDEVDIVNTVADMLELKDIATIQTTRGKDAVRIYRQRQDEISLVLLDLMMPGMNGEEVFHKLRDINPDVKVVLSSGYSEAEATRRFIGQRLADFIQKPYDFNTLINKISGSLEAVPV